MNDRNPSSKADGERGSLVQNLVRTRLPTRHGEFFLYYYNNALEQKEHLALVKKRVEDAADVAVRLHSECLTGDVFGSLRCDCGDQLDRALRIIGQEPCGVLLYLRQEGRGIGLLKKLQAYNLQDEGLDTVEANLRLGHRSDERDYRIAAAILQDLKIRSVRLITNNPAKIEQLRRLGIAVGDRIPIEIPFNAENEGYLRTKARKMQHLLSFKVRQRPTGEFGFLDGLIRRLEERPAVARPFVTVAHAAGLDGGVLGRSDLAGVGGGRLLRLFHYLDGHHGAVLVTGAELAAAGDAFGSAGLVLVADPPLRWTAAVEGCHRAGLPVAALAAAEAPPQRLASLASQGVAVISLPFAAGNCPDPAALWELARGRGIRSIATAAEIGNGLAARGAADYCLVALVPRFGGAAPALAQPEPLQLAECHYHALDGAMISHGPFSP